MSSSEFIGTCHKTISIVIELQYETKFSLKGSFIVITDLSIPREPGYALDISVSTFQSSLSCYFTDQLVLLSDSDTVFED